MSVFVSVVFCTGRGLCDGLMTVHRSLIDCGVSECIREV
jgi:hypothetical protein